MYLCTLFKTRIGLDEKIIAPLRVLLANQLKKIVIVTHTNPDGDALGSGLALYGLLHNAGFAHVDMIVPNDFPDFLSWLPESQKIVVAKRQPENSHEIIRNAQLIFCLDMNSFSRADNLERYLIESSAAKVLIDHHPFPENQFDIIISDTNVSSTAEMIYLLAVELNWKSLINKEVAACLYTGIVTDTGSFSYSCNRHETYEAMAELMKTGIEGAEMHRLIYSTFSENRIRLLGYCLSEKLTVLHEQKTAYISLSRSELDTHNHQVGDTEGIVNYAMSIDGIDMAAFFTENHNYIRISFRSSGEMDVNEFARNYFNGGGHRNASGGKSFEPMDKTLKRFEELIREIRSQ